MKNLKKLLLMVPVLLLLWHCKKEEKFIITGSINPKIETDSMYVVGYNNEKIASAKVVNGKFVLEGSVKEPMRAFLVSGENGTPLSHKMILENDNYTLDLSENNFEFKGGKLNTMLFGFYDSPEYKDLVKQHTEKGAEFEKIDNEEDEKRVTEEFNEIEKKMFAIEKESFNKMINSDQPPLVKLIVLTLSQDWEGYPIEKQKVMLDEFEKKLGKHPLIEDHRKYLATANEPQEPALPSPEVGTTYKDVVAKDVDGKEIKLSEAFAKNKLVILDFWASWCGPCRAEIPNLKKAYEKYKSKGLEIYSISIDEKKDLWLKALKEENTPWINVLDEKNFAGVAAKDYGVDAIPAVFLISKDGKILAKNDELRAYKLDKAIEKFIK